ncbi:MAG TPA: diacylglycerol kinase [Gammaproteobacteria bacterium]|nr:diacylglycerol kinase [Gammaproteobacteria bacterium]
MNVDGRASDGLAGLTRLNRATRVGFTALAWAFRNEEAFRLEVLGSLVLVPVGIWLGHGGAEKALLAAAVIQVMIVELLNTGIEVVVDRISVERHALSGLAKDLGSAAVMISLLLATVVWACVILSRFFG